MKTIDKLKQLENIWLSVDDDFKDIYSELYSLLPVGREQDLENLFRSYAQIRNENGKSEVLLQEGFSSGYKKLRV